MVKNYHISHGKVLEMEILEIGYYRDQTCISSWGFIGRKFFAQLYADTSVEREPASAGRQMNSHFATAV